MGYRSGVVKLPLRLIGRGGCGRSCDHAARVPAVLCSCFWRCLRFSSTSECRKLQLWVRTSQVQVMVAENRRVFTGAVWGYSSGATLGSTVDTCCATVLGCFWTCSHIFYVKAEPRIPKSISSCSPASRGLEKCAQSMLQWYYRGGCTWKFGHYLCEPLASGSHLFAVRASPHRSFLSPR